jgi:hypothetical protein
MRKYIRILEVPILLLTIAVGCFNDGSNVIGLSLLIISIVRLVVNVITDEFNYKR